MLLSFALILPTILIGLNLLLVIYLDFGGIDLGFLVLPAFYMGLVGGLLPVGITVAYLVTYQRESYAPAPLDEPVVVTPVRDDPPPKKVKQRKHKDKVNAWLVTRDGRNYQLNAGRTSIGRSSRNDIKIDGDGTVSGQHARIEEQNLLFSLPEGDVAKK